MPTIDDDHLSPPTARQEWRRGWPLVLLSVLALAIGNVMFYSLGPLTAPIQQDTGWSRAQINLGLPVTALVLLGVLPIVGRLTDRFGVRRLVTPGLAAFGLSIMAISLLSVSYWTYIAAFLLAQICGAFLGVTIWFAAIARIFDRQRGLAMAIAMCGSALGTAFVPVVTAWLASHFDWRQVYLVIGAAIFCLVLPLLLVFRAMPALDETGASPVTRAHAPSIRIALLLRSRHFLSLAFISFLMLATLSAMTGLFAPVLASKGHSPIQAAAIAGLIGAASIIGRLITGVVMDRSSGPIMGVLCFALPITAAILLLTDGSSAWVAAVAALTLGFCAGAEMDVIGYVTARYFGSRGFGGVFSLLAVAMAIGVGVGPWAASYSYDLTKSYDLLLINVIPLSLLAGLLLATLGPWRLVLPSGEEHPSPAEPPSNPTGDRDKGLAS